MEQSQSERLAAMLKVPLQEMVLDQLHEVRDEITNAIDNIRHQLELAQIAHEQNDDFDPIWYSRAKRALNNYQLRNRQIGREIRKRHATSPKAIFATTFMDVVRDAVSNEVYQGYITKTKAKVHNRKEERIEHKQEDYKSYLDKEPVFDEDEDN